MAPLPSLYCSVLLLPREGCHVDMWTKHHQISKILKSFQKSGFLYEILWILNLLYTILNIGWAMLDPAHWSSVYYLWLGPPIMYSRWTLFKKRTSSFLVTMFFLYNLCCFIFQINENPFNSSMASQCPQSNLNLFSESRSISCSMLHIYLCVWWSFHQLALPLLVLLVNSYPSSTPAGMLLAVWNLLCEWYGGYTINQNRVQGEVHKYKTIFVIDT